MSINISLELRATVVIEEHVEYMCFMHAIQRAAKGEDVSMEITETDSEDMRIWTCYDCISPEDRWWTKRR